MRRNVNQETIEGRIYEHDLAIKTVKNEKSKNFGKEFIQGTLSVATDEAGLNVLTVHYTYVTETTSKGNVNATYLNLKRIIESGKTWVQHGKNEANLIRLSTSAALNDFYPQGGEQLVSQQRNEGGFVSFVNELKPEGEPRQKFIFDTIIKGFEYVEASPERNIDKDYGKISCVIFNFKNDILPFTLIAKDPNAINYFESLEPSPSNPIYTQVWGEILNTTVKIERTIESAFGTPAVDISERSQKEWVVTGAKPEPYVFDSDDTITAKELENAIANRNLYLEEVKTRAKEYYASRGNAIPANTPAPAPTVNNTVPAGDFNF